MKKQKKCIFLSLFLAMAVGWTMIGGQARAAGQTPGPSLAYLYTSTDEAGEQLILASVQAGGESPDEAFLVWEEGGKLESVSAAEILDGYVAFLVKGAVIAEEQMRFLELSYGQDACELDIQEFRNAQDTVALPMEELPVEELPVAASAEDIGSRLEEAEDSKGISSFAGTIRDFGGLNRNQDDIVVVLDPGHGGTDGGAQRTWNGILYREKDITLKISQYTKEELETYAGVRVYMTRSSDVAVDLGDRVDYGASVGATVLISQHINSTESYQTAVTGAEVMVSKGNYRPAQAQETAVIARKILEELTKIGFKNRDLVYKLSETGNTYPNGKLADYYAIVRRCVLAGFPGMIVEHGFVSNPDDCVKYYGSDAKIKKLGVADATAIAKYYGLQKKDCDGWHQEKGHWYYMTADGERVPKGWLDLDGQKYYLDERGYRVTGWQVMNNKKYYFDSAGILQTQMTYIDGLYYYFNSKGVLKKGLFQGMDGNYYYANSKGVLYSGWKTCKGERYYFAKNRYAARKGWAKLGKTLYYFNELGQLQTGLVTIDQATYFLDEKGRRQTGLVDYEGRKYYFSKNTGKMKKKKWVKVSGKHYYVSKYGYVLRNRSKVIGGVRYKFDKNGVCLNR